MVLFSHLIAHSSLLGSIHQIYKDWFYNHGAKKRARKANAKFGKKWTARTVIEVQRKKEILLETGAKPGDKDMIGNYQAALNAIIAGLSEEEMKDAHRTAEEWSKRAPPPEVQAAFAFKKADLLIEDLASQLWKQGGMRIFVLSAWKNSDGEVLVNG